MGSPPDSCAHISHAELGDGVQEVVSCIQAADLLWVCKGEETEAARLV